MSTCYIQLPEIYKTYIKDNIMETICEVEKSTVHVGNLDRHSIFRVPKNVVLTKEGLIRFSNYWPIVDIFKLAPNCSTALHLDNSYHAFNFVVTNNGYMEWFDLNKLEYAKTILEGQQIYKFLEEAIIEKTECNMMWVNTKIPHRIVNNTDSYRYCLSVRTLNDIPVVI
jgi:uncharacterized RmlC-like cupin family protein